MKKSRNIPAWTIPLGVIAVMAALTFTGQTRDLEYKILDLYTALVPPPPERPEIVLLDADDQAIQNVGQWPWSRDFHARYLAELRSLGASSLTFDIEFVDPGIRGLPNRERESVLVKKVAELGDVFGALKGKQITVGEAEDYSRTLLTESVELTARDNDELLGQSLKLFGKAYTTLNYANDLIAFEGNASAEAALAYLKAHSAVGPVTGRLDLVTEVPGLRGAIVPIAGQGAGAAVTNVDKDTDGTLRRMSLLYRLKGTDLVFGQLAFVPLWVDLGKPAIEVTRSKLILRTSALAKGARPDVVIPLDPSGKMVINWPHDLYKDSFQHVRVAELQNLEAAWDDPAHGLRPWVVAMQRAGYFEEDLEGQILQIEGDRTAAQAAGDQGAFDGADQALAAWVKQVADLAGGTRPAQLRLALRRQAEDPALSRAVRDAVPQRLAEVDKSFASLTDKLKAYQDRRAALSAKLKGAMVIYGWTSEATTDIGVTPFDPKYFNPGTHAAVANTILTGKYLNQWPAWGGFLLGALLALGVSLVVPRLGTLTGVVVGFGSFVLLLLGIGVFYAATGTYTGALVPGLTVFLTILGLTLVNFWSTEAEKRFIRGAFGTYLSPEVIKQLEADPDKLSLGGEKKVLTAVFTDVKGFSTFSESMDPNDLVRLLNGYLTEMSDIILDTRGTIDKFEGDAIIAFWGAPLPFEDHAPRAVAAALRMKKAEGAMNQRFVAEGLARTPLLTRIGINTGEMTVGNMGTARRMDYTMMGTSVNLAARLEGVNKEYGTWILTTGATRERLDDSVVVRRLDQVRVVGIKTPVRLFEVVAFRSDATDALTEKLARFDQAIEAYDAGQWDDARIGFEAVLALDPDDAPAQTFLGRTALNRQAGFGPGWDGVFTMTRK